MEARRRRRDNDALIANGLDRWLALLPPGTGLQSSVSPPPLGPVADLPAAIEERSATIRELKAEERRVASSPPPVAELTERAREYVLRLAEKGRPRIAGTAGSFAVNWTQASGDRLDPIAVLRRGLIPNA